LGANAVVLESKAAASISFMAIGFCIEYIGRVQLYAFLVMDVSVSSLMTMRACFNLTLHFRISFFPSRIFMTHIRVPLRIFKCNIYIILAVIIHHRIRLFSKQSQYHKER
jgi:hypothetical protein